MNVDKNSRLVFAHDHPEKVVTTNGSTLAVDIVSSVVKSCRGSEWLPQVLEWFLDKLDGIWYLGVVYIAALCFSLPRSEHFTLASQVSYTHVADSQHLLQRFSSRKICFLSFSGFLLKFLRWLRVCGALCIGQFVDAVNSVLIDYHFLYGVWFGFQISDFSHETFGSFKVEIAASLTKSHRT